MTRQETQQMVDKLAQQYIDRMRAAHVKRDADLQAQIDECKRQQLAARMRLRELDS